MTHAEGRTCGDAAAGRRGRTGAGGPSVAIVGGGASGALCATHLLRESTRSGALVRITIIDRDGGYGPGLAYGTTYPRHRLNVPAGRMSVFPDQPEHFVEWARGAGVPADPGAFLARGLYGSYLTEVLASAERDALPGAIEWVPAEATEVSVAPDTAGLRIGLSGREPIDADCVILALGVLPREPPGWATKPGCAARYVADPLRGDALGRIEDGDDVLLLGTGLTMVDVALRLTERRPRLTIRAVSRHGLLPHRHRPADPAAGSVPAVNFSPSSGAGPRDLVRAIRRAAAVDPCRWREVVDSLRARSEQVWSGLDHDSRRVLLARFGRYWDIHRHRMAPEVAVWIDDLVRRRQLRLGRGSVVEAADDGDALLVRLLQDGQLREQRFHWIVDCSGPPADVSRSPDRLTAQLLTSGFARVEPLRLGLETDPGGRLIARDGRPHSNAFTLGPPRRGGLFETTAIPELREQAQSLAEKISALLYSGSRRRGAGAETAQ
ncbi:hypothetical protein E0504_43465 [Parafrankia sp. BMG5.11]|nr:hypothetical protein E0504_43465 [Parafrankia sp. BMG5.11]